MTRLGKDFWNRYPLLELEAQEDPVETIPYVAIQSISDASFIQYQIVAANIVEGLTEIILHDEDFYYQAEFFLIIYSVETIDTVDRPKILSQLRHVCLHSALSDFMCTPFSQLETLPEGLGYTIAQGLDLDLGPYPDLWHHTDHLFITRLAMTNPSLS